MSRAKGTLLGTQGYGKLVTAPMVDLKRGGQHGPSPQFDSYISSTAYVRKNMIALLLEAPQGFKLMDNPTKWVEALKALVEAQPLTIEGLQGGLTVDTVDTNFGGGGEIQQDPGKVNRARSQVQFTWKERYGKPISYFLREWITNLIQDPNTGAPGVVSRGTAAPADLLPDFYGMTCVFFEPDPTFTKVMEAWLVTNMYPLGTGDIIGRRDMSAAGEGSELNIEFTGITQHGYGIRKFAQSLYDRMNLSGLDTNMQKSFIDAVDADVRAVDSGYTNLLDKVAAERVA
jgi:hypothetical protein